MKRVLLVIKSLSHGGAQRLLIDAVRLGDRKRFDYRVAFLLRDHDALAAELRAADVDVRCLDAGGGAGWAVHLRRLVDSEQVELVHVHSPYAAAGARLALRRATPLVYTEHALWTAYHPATRWANIVTYPRNDRVLAVSEAVRRSVRYPSALRVLRMPRVETLHHGRDGAATPTPTGRAELERAFGIPAGAPLVATVAAFRPEKGHADLLRAAAEVRESVPDARFLLIGSGSGEAAARQRADALGLDGSVVFAGHRDDAVSLAGACDVFALASLHEGLPVALLDAMALGSAVAVTDAGGLPEVVRDGLDGVVAPAGEPAALAAAITGLLEDPERRRALGQAAQRRAGAFDLRQAVRRIEGVYDELLA